MFIEGGDYVTALQFGFWPYYVIKLKVYHIYKNIILIFSIYIIEMYFGFHIFSSGL